MYQNIITSTQVWERGLEFEEERRRTGRREPTANYLAPVQRLPRERKPLLARLFKPRPQPEPAVYTPNRECCPET